MNKGSLAIFSFIYMIFAVLGSIFKCQDMIVIFSTAFLVTGALWYAAGEKE